ncbi:response regulator [Noviherbaspirillum saxi]
MGCITSVAFNARTALEMARNGMPDLIFCDLRLPGEKSGFDVAAALRADAGFAHIPLIAVTGFDDSMGHQRAKDAGFDRVFEKPVKFAQIQDVLNTYRKG